MMRKYVYILTFIEIFSFGLLIPVLGSQLIAIGGNRFLLGLLTSLQSLLQFIAGPIFGSWSDNVGAKLALLLSAYGLLIGQLIFSVPLLYFYIIGRIVNACFLHGQILTKTLLAEAKVTDQSALQAKLRAIGALSFTFSPIIGGFIMGQENGFWKLSILCCALSLINVIVCHMLPPTSRTTTTEQNGGRSNMAQIFANLKAIDWSVFGTLFMHRFLVETAASIYHQNLGYVFADEFKCTPAQVGLIVSFYGVCSIIVNVKMQAIKRALPDGAGYMSGTIAIMLSFVVIYMLPYFWTYIAFIVSFCIFKTLLDAMWTDSILAMCNERNSGAVNGGFQSLVQLAGFAAPLMNGYMAEMYGYESTTLICIALGGVACAICLRIKDGVGDVAADSKERVKVAKKTN